MAARSGVHPPRWRMVAAVAEDDQNNNVIFAAPVPVPVISITPTTTEDLARPQSIDVVVHAAWLVVKLKRVTG